MITETSPTHIQFEPLILKRKTPAEELREILESTYRGTCSDHNRARRELEALAARLEASDEPKRWDGVFPWVSEFGPYYANVHFSPVLRWHLISNGTCIYTGEAHKGDKPSSKSPYHDGVIITITAGSGDEDVKVLRGTADDRWLYLALGEHSVVLTDPYGDDVGEAKDRWPKHCEPLPPGTITRITINNHGATTEQRYSVEVVEPEKAKDWLPIEPIGRYLRLDRHADSDKLELRYRNGTQIIDIDKFCAAELRDCLTRWLDESRTDPPEEQPTMEAVAEGPPLEFRCDTGYPDVLYVSKGTQGRLLFAVNNSKGVALSPADESRLRNLLNQRHASKKGNE